MFRLFQLSCVLLVCLLVVTLYRRLPQEIGWLWQAEQTNVGLVSKVAELQLAAPAVIAAGERVTVTVVALPFAKTDPVGATSVPNLPLQLFFFNTNGTTLLEGMLQEGTAKVLLDETLTQVAGEVTLQATVADAQATTTMRIAPDLPVEPVLALVGPRSIPADGTHWTMLTVLPHDRFGNAVADGTAVTVRTLHPATALANPLGDTTALHAEIETSVVETSHLFAWARIYSRTKTGYMAIAANAGAAHSPERTVLAVPGPPVPFTLQVEPIQLMADGRRLVTVVTEALTDAYGNPLLDGTAVTFLVVDEAERERRLPAQVIDGRATVQIQAPTQPGTLEIAALILNITSRPLTLDFTAGIGVAPIDVHLTASDDLYRVVAGPLLGPLGQYIPDGSVVDFAFRSTDSDTIVHHTTAPAEAGFATAVVRKSTLPPGSYRVLVTAGVGTGETTINHR